jgi:hypothetical protein
MEAAGIEPSIDFAATGNLPCGCVICEECRAAPALHFWGAECPLVSCNGVDCQDGDCPPAVLRAWFNLPPHIRDAILTLVEAGMPSANGRPGANALGDDNSGDDLA